MSAAKRVVVTGGGGYGNLGDDAILVSTLGLLAAGGADQIDALTYQSDSSLLDGVTRARFVDSMHRRCDNGVAEGLFRPIDSSISRHRYFHSKVVNLAQQRMLVGKPYELGALAKPFGEEVLRDASLFVVSGGGYLNEGWISKTASVLDELTVACDLGVPVVVAGPTFGGFRDLRMKSRFYDAFRRAEAIWVRDEFSRKDLIDYGIEAEVIPDVALADFDFTPCDRGGREIGLIVNKVDEHLTPRLIEALQQMRREKQCGAVTLVMSRLWDCDLRAIRHFLARARATGLVASLFVPGDVFDLERKLRTCVAVISENLHGLIIASRNGVPVVAINDYPVGKANHRKFVAFMEQLAASRFVVGSGTSKSELLDLVLERMENSDDALQSSIALCERTRDQAVGFFRRALTPAAQVPGG